MVETLMNSFECQAVIRLLLAALLTGIIGYEREAWKKPAGMRTHILVGESAVIIMLCGIYLAQTTPGVDPTRIPAQLLSGIGFIGAGTILRDGLHVKGLTTAASLLAVTGIGLTIGAGAYVIAILATFVVYVILSYTYVVSDSAEKYTEFSFRIITSEQDRDLKSIEKVFVKDEILLKSIRTEKEFIIVKGKMSEEISRNKIITSLMKVESVQEVIEE